MAIRDLFIRLRAEAEDFSGTYEGAQDDLKKFGKEAKETEGGAGTLGKALDKYLGPAVLRATAALVGRAAWEIGQSEARAEAVDRNLSAFAGVPRRQRSI